MRNSRYCCRCVVLATFCAALLVPAVGLPAAGEWEVSGALLHPRGQPAVARLSPTLVLVVGGATEAEVYDLQSGKSESAGNLSMGFASPSAVTLTDGRVLVVASPFQGAPVAEVWDPGAKSFAVISPPPLQGAPGPAALLGDGRVLVTGGLMVIDPGVSGLIFDHAALFDPMTDSWELANPMNESRALHAVTSLGDGRVVVAGGRTGSLGQTQFAMNAEIYDPVQNAFTLLGNFQYGALGGSVLELGDGRVLAANAGGAELLDLETGATSLAYEYPGYRTSYSAVLLPGPRALIYGGTSAEVYDPANESWESIAPPLQWRDEAAGVAGPGGKAFLLGGRYWDGSASQNLASVEAYDSGFGTAVGQPCAQALECLTGYCVDGVCCAEACPQDTPCLSPTCEGGTCDYLAVEQGQSCDDSEPCTSQDACDALGVCGGQPYMCEPGPCHQSAQCNGDGTCNLVSVQDGTLCQASGWTGAEGTCVSGVCTHGALTDVVPEEADAATESDLYVKCGVQNGSGCSTSTGFGTNSIASLLLLLFLSLLLTVYPGRSRS